MQKIEDLVAKSYVSLTAGDEWKNTLPLQRISEIKAIISKYGSRRQLLQLFSVEQQARHTAPQHLRRCFMGTAPTLTDADQAFGDGTAEEWLTYQLTALAEYSGALDKLTRWQLQELVRMVRLEYHGLKLTELEVFFTWFKQGRYGQFYGAIDPLVITTALRRFRSDRYEMLDVYQREEERRRREAALSSPTRMTRDEYDEYCIRRPFLRWICLACHPDMPAFHVDEDWREVKERRRKLENEKRRKLEKEEERRRKLENKEIRECRPEFFFIMNLPLEMIFWMLDVFCQCVRIATYVPEGDKADEVVIDAMSKVAKLVLPEP